MKVVHFLYEDIATHLEEEILNGVLQLGDKLPSVRMFSKQHNVSASTIFQAYYTLESKGLIEARPKSGYYVIYQPKKFIPSFTDTVVETTPAIHELTTDAIISHIVDLLSAKEYTHLSTARPDLSLLPTATLQKSMKAALTALGADILNYDHPTGNEILRQLIAGQQIKFGETFDSKDIVITSGCTEALTLCLQATTQKGDIVISDSLTYYGIHQIIKNLGLKVIPVPIHTTTGLDLNFLKRSLERFPVKACLLTTNFNNPTGMSLTTSQKKKLVKLVTKHEVPLIEDDVYGELYFGKHRPSTCKQFDTEGLVMYCSSFSKTLAPGFRVGYAIPGKFTATVTKLKRIHSLGSSTLSQQALVAFFAKGRYPYHLKRLRQTLHTNMLAYCKCVYTYFPENIYVTPPSGGYILWIAFPKYFDSIALFEAAKEHHLTIAPGQIFSMNDSHKNYIRLSFSKPLTESIEKAIQLLGELAKQLIYEN
ncbi:PLP-dependent aminotransferase family protein [uncultured Kordia sp.]|uniref:aminotransferase-like domain-containing protein n=1 Tax=uncultured Kordia sp. TaxID=507699 RepID=UPI0026215821|nr:PLP-dependent aminotransferase family protein [uncultured Kordia sp.]